MLAGVERVFVSNLAGVNRVRRANLSRRRVRGSAKRASSHRSVPKWPERWERLTEAIGIIRALWSGQQVAHPGKYYIVDAKLYDTPPQPIPLLRDNHCQHLLGP